ncbi:hypothetical protein AAOGI_17460 [Agarivorans albus]
MGMGQWRSLWPRLLINFRNGLNMDKENYLAFCKAELRSVFFEYQGG